MKNVQVSSITYSVIRSKEHGKRPLIIALILSGLFLTPQNICYSRTKEAHVIQISDHTINPVTASYIIDSIDRAYREDAECLIIELDTPGGLLTSTRSIVKKIMSAKIPVIVFIYPSGSRAGSAGVFITYASHIAAMAPSTNIGAAYPVQMGGERTKTIWKEIKELLRYISKKYRDEEDTVTEGEKPQEDILSDKILHDTVAFVKTLAKERERNIRWAEESVRESASITEMEAFEKNVIEIIARDTENLLEQLDGADVKIDGKRETLDTKDIAIRYIPMDFRQRLLNVLANPNIAYILLILGFYGLLFEVTHPGVGFPGIAGAICLILAFFSMQILPTNYAGLALMGLGIILFIAEISVPGFGLLTLGGLICMALGSLLLFESPYQIMRVSLLLIISFTIATALVTIVLIRAVIKTHRRKVISGKEGLIGEVGTVRDIIYKDKAGKIFVHGETWDAIGEEYIRVGEKAQVVDIDRMALMVKKVK